MTKAHGARFSKQEFARRGDEIYQRDVQPRISPQDDGKFVAIDIETGDYEVDGDEIASSDRLLDRRPAAQLWLRQIGSRYAHRLGRRSALTNVREPAAV